MKKDNEFYQIGNKLGLSKKDLNYILDNPNTRIEQPSFSMGGPRYPGTFYGSISVDDF